MNKEGIAHGFIREGKSRPGGHGLTPTFSALPVQTTVAVQARAPNDTHAVKLSRVDAGFHVQDQS